MVMGGKGGILTPQFHITTTTTTLLLLLLVLVVLGGGITPLHFPRWHPIPRGVKVMCVVIVAITGASPPLLPSLYTTTTARGVEPGGSPPAPLPPPRAVQWAQVQVSPPTAVAQQGGGRGDWRSSL